MRRRFVHLICLVILLPLVILYLLRSALLGIAAVFEYGAGRIDWCAGDGKMWAPLLRASAWVERKLWTRWRLTGRPYWDQQRYAGGKIVTRKKVLDDIENEDDEAGI